MCSILIKNHLKSPVRPYSIADIPMKKSFVILYEASIIIGAFVIKILIAICRFGIII